MTLRDFFDKYNWINQSEVARVCEINESLFRQYVTGDKRPSLKRLCVIEDTIRQMLTDAQDFELTFE